MLSLFFWQLLFWNGFNPWLAGCCCGLKSAKKMREAARNINTQMPKVAAHQLLSPLSTPHSTPQISTDAGLVTAFVSDRIPTRLLVAQ